MKFCKTFTFSLAASILLENAVVRIIDPRGDFGAKIFPKVITDSRADKQSVFLKYHAAHPVQGLILGSSRSMKIPPSELQRLTGLRFFNFAVESGRAEDCLAIYRWVRRHGCQPRCVIIGLDVEALHNDLPFDVRLKKNPELVQTLGDSVGVAPLLWKTWVHLLHWIIVEQDTLTISYLRDSMLAVEGRLRTFRPEAYFDADGLEHLVRWESQRAHGTYNLESHLVLSLPEYVDRFKDMTQLSAEREGYMETLIREAQADGATVKVWLTCIHPRTTRYLKTRTRYFQLLAETRSYLAYLHRAYRIATYDYSDPSAFGGTLTGWYDGAHVDEQNAALICAGLMRDTR